MSTDEELARPRRRLSREERQRQLLDMACQLIREEGTDALTLGRLAEQAGVTKPVVYDHFGTRAGLLSALYVEFDARQTALMDAALQASEASLQSRAGVIAAAYVECVLQQGREIPGVNAALTGSPELESLKCEHESAFLDKCRDALEPFAGKGGISTAGLRAMLGAADGLSHAAATGEITPKEAREELCATIVAMVERSALRV
ncbi:TetR/AcrR family transcriptional regulator [Pseudomonas resinovorans]|uniref:TetR/AcrR family transcriptional regulator n=1 Tax=Metapseudomonas resinovorans TaxID=53412 RepID=A0ABT4Y3E9_METRE|nr:TetR/AcrR family transcriptional regulator [Pseudomonas resinovorans]MDA8483368.1 TetR/AcrR family transcriptional regulator [Pseudomonas resinovorans]